ncbi:carbonic anhydrase [Croceicoccus gelatinilyticus]|uniref:carbonic anhydrase n=1 Tax=Croceicoccus gelatinilyticus TaxID=2835536 RepID=UPI001BCCABB1|nr:carbonic anhydrase [Croceicoccus gelatinilyticus]MBS7668696.1 carbonic anhydrase [Croceicoccus gelatinilyticus]
MNEFIGRVFSFERSTFPESSALFGRLTKQGQSPTALMISCADSRVVPEQIMQADPGDLFVCRNAGNIVPPFATMNGGVSSTVEYAVMALNVSDIIICGHSDCGAMKALSKPETLEGMPNVAAWLRHGSAASHIVDSCMGDLEDGDRVRALSLENVIAQLNNLRTHPSVSAAMARGDLALHGWFVDIHEGVVLGLDGETGQFRPLREGDELPVAHHPQNRHAYAEAAE